MHFLHDAIGLKDSRHLFIQSEVKPKPIVTRSHAFSRALRQPHVITSSFDWFNVLSVSYVIGQSNYFGFGFTTLKRKPLYTFQAYFHKMQYFIAELWRACGAPWVSKCTHPRKFGYHVTVHRPPARPPAARPSAPQAYQCLLSHFLATLGAQEKADCTSMLSSIDSCQNRVSADQYHLTVLRAQVSTHQGRVFF